MSRTTRRLFTAAAGVLALLAIASAARAQDDAHPPVPAPASTEFEPLQTQSADATFSREVEVSGDMFGVRWTGDPAATFAISTLEDDGWTPAQVVGRLAAEVSGDPGTAEAASAVEGPYATEPLWSGDATAVRVSVVSGTASDLEVIAVTSGQLPDSSSTDFASLGLGGSAVVLLGVAALGTGMLARLRRGVAVGVAVALAVSAVAVVAHDEAEAGGVDTPPPPHLISRKEWGARKPQCAFGTFKRVRFAIIHHTAGANNYGPFDGPGIVQGLQAYFMDQGGPDPYCDIAYNFLVDKYGNSYVGRARSARVERPIYGAHTSGHNKGSRGIAVLGNYQTAAFPKQANRALKDVLAWRFLEHGIDPLGKVKSKSAGGASKWPAGTSKTVSTISSHRVFNPTKCPGFNIRSKIDGIRKGTAKRMS